MRWAEKLARPWLAGAAYVVLLAVHAAGASDESAETLGAHASAINSFVRTRYATDISKVVIAIVLVAAVAGAFLGTLAGQLVELRDRATREERSRLSVTARALLVTVALHAWLELVAMADTPALYVDGFYARGGLARTVQVLAADTFGGGALVVFGLLAIMVFVAGPPRVWPTLPERLRAFALRVPTSWQTAGVWAGAGVLAALSVVAFALTPHPHHATGAPHAKLNVLVIAADSLRFDRLNPKLAPHLSALADRGTRFDRAYVSLPRTFPSWVTILSGRHPHHHGIRTMFPRWDDRAKDFDALPERLAKAGYRTSVVSDFAGDIFSRIDLGFGEIDTPTFDMRELVRQRAVERETPLLPFLVTRAGRGIFPVVRELATAADPQLVAHDALRSIDRADGSPFFETVFFSTAHFPYAAPQPYAAAFTRAAYRGRFKYDKPVGLGSDVPPDVDDLAQARGLYDGAVASIDDAVEVLMKGLDDRGLTESTIIVITADHGESLGEPGRGSGHGDHLFGDEGTHVPFVVIDPRRAPQKRVQTIVRDVDLAPTLYELTGVAAPSDLDGRSLVPALAGASIPEAFAYAETGLWFTQEIQGVPPGLRIPYPTLEGLTELDPVHGDEIVLAEEMKNLTLVAKHRMVRDERWKLVYAPTRAGVVYRLFDTQADPQELHDLAASRPAEVARLKVALWQWMLEDRAMTERRGWLVPRTDAVRGDAEGIRVEAAR